MSGDGGATRTGLLLPASSKLVLANGVWMAAGIQQSLYHACHAGKWVSQPSPSIGLRDVGTPVNLADKQAPGRLPPGRHRPAAPAEKAPPQWP